MEGMMGKKSMLRKKALESMMKEGPSIAISIKKKADPMQMGDSQDEMEGEPQPVDQMEEGQGDEQGQGFESMMVSPEEKKMLMVLRQKAKSGDMGSEVA